jgi:hypothetical protein
LKARKLEQQDFILSILIKEIITIVPVKNGKINILIELNYFIITNRKFIEKINFIN